MIGIGIDTGGTCTDAVVYDTEKHEVLSSSKTVTTKRDLKIGILEALKGLDPDAISKAGYVSLSTTLATNACVEDLGCRAKLVFIGVQPKAVARMDGVYGLPSPNDIFFLNGDPGRIDPGEREPDWEDFYRRLPELAEYDCIALVQINPNYNNGGHENKAAAIISEELGIPCVKGYDLYQEINVLRRGATALLNARLIPIMNNFFNSMEESLRQMHIDLPILVVKSNGNIMTKEFAMSRPVDTLLSGPAASVMGAVELLGGREGIVCDIGGTTTDVAMVRGGTPVSAGQGITIGRWRTMVKGISIDTFALGGDTVVVNDEGTLSLSERRAIPLCSLAVDRPEVKSALQTLLSKGIGYGYPAQDFFVLAQEPAHPEIYGERDRRIIEFLRERPLSYDHLSELMGVSPYIFKPGRLEDEGVIIRAGVTPTDVMHVRGEFNGYDTEASELGLKYLSYATGKPVSEVCDLIYHFAKERLFSNLAKILLSRETGSSLDPDEAAQLEKLTSLLYRKQESALESRYISLELVSPLPVIGIGGPSEIIVGDVPEKLGTKALFPEHKEIANAIGATVGSMSTSFTVRIEPDNLRNWGYKYYVIGGDDVEGYNSYDKAKKRATDIARQRVKELVDKQGAQLNSEITLDVDEDFHTADGKRVFVLTEITARMDSELKDLKDITKA